MSHLLYPDCPHDVEPDWPNNLRGIYVRFEDHSIESTALVEVKEMVAEIQRISEEREAEDGSGLYAHMVQPWVADELLAHANCVVTYVYAEPGTGGESTTDTKRSKLFKSKRDNPNPPTIPPSA